MAEELNQQWLVAAATPDREPPPTPWSVEADADALMDDLFSDIDRILDGGSKLPTAPAQFATAPPAPRTLSTAARPGVVPAAAPQPAATLRQQPRSAAPTQGAAGAAPWTLLWQQHADKVFFAAACLALVAVSTALALQQRLPWQRRLPATSQVPDAAVPLSEQDQHFIGYMLRSLRAIERRNGTVAQNSASPASQLPASQLPAAPGQAPQVIERVYIPVYPPNTSSSTATVVPPPSGNRTPAMPGGSRASRPSPSAPSPASRPSPTAARSPATDSLQAALPQLEALPTLPALPNLEPPDEQQSPAQAGYKLVGLLDSGDRSAALFESNGTTQRVSVDEEIGDTGWRLVAAANQVAIIERRGETRSLYVGQSF